MYKHKKKDILDCYHELHYLVFYKIQELNQHEIQRLS